MDATELRYVFHLRSNVESRGRLVESLVAVHATHDGAVQLLRKLLADLHRPDGTLVYGMKAEETTGHCPSIS